MLHVIEEKKKNTTEDGDNTYCKDMHVRDTCGFMKNSKTWDHIRKHSRVPKN